MPNELSERVRELQNIASVVQWARLKFETRDGHLVNNSVALVMFGMLPWLQQRAMTMLALQSRPCVNG